MKIFLHLSGRDNLDEVVFANRNKAYGAYVLRNEYSNYLSKALFLGVAFFVSLAAIPLLVNYFTEKVVDGIPVNPPIVLHSIDVSDPPVSQPITSIPKNIKTINPTVPTPTRNVAAEFPSPNKKETDNAAIGSETEDGIPTDIAVVPTITANQTATIPVVITTVIPVDPNKIIPTEETDVPADFKGGIDAFRRKVGQNFDTTAVSDEGMISAIVTFVVEKDGSISNIKVSGKNSDFNKEAERTIKSVKTKWTPAQLKGQAVRSSFRMPISMQLEYN